MQIKLCKKALIFGKWLIVAAINMFGMEYIFKIITISATCEQLNKPSSNI